jgi:hypothetical protein
MTGIPLEQAAAMQFTAMVGVSGVPGGTPPPAPSGLIHLTNDTGLGGITRTSTIIGQHGIYAVPDYVAGESTAMKVLRTGLMPGNTQNAVPIPNAATSLFQRPLPIGPYSAWKYFLGVRYAAPGVINTVDGSFTATPSLIGPRTLIYEPDGLFYGTGAGLYLRANQGGKQ